MRLPLGMVLALVGAAGCHDYDKFRTSPDGAVADLAGAALGDLAGCPTPGAAPAVGSGCMLYTFAAGVPSGLVTTVPKSDSSVRAECGMLRVQLGAGASHDLWIDNVDSVRVEEATPRSGPFTLSARVHGALDRNQKFSGLYASDGSGRFVSVQTSTDATGLHDHDVVFVYGAGSAEQAQYPVALPEAGDSYAYELARLADTTQFRLTGSQVQTLTVTAPAALTVGVAVGNCCGGTAPAVDAYVEWMMVCQ